MYSANDGFARLTIFHQSFCFPRPKKCIIKCIKKDGIRDTDSSEEFQKKVEVTRQEVWKRKENKA